MHALRQLMSGAFNNAAWRDLLGVSQNTFQVCLERPLQGEIFGSAIELQGWVLFDKRRSISADVILHGHRVVALAVADSREDVRRAYGLSQEIAALGFKHRLLWSDCTDCGDIIKLSLRFSDGIRTQLLGPFTFSRRMPLSSVRVCLESPLPGQRAANGVWISGWVAGTDRQLAGRVLAFGKEVSKFLAAERRDDVAQAYGLHSGDQALGFRHFLEWGQLPCADERIDLTVEIAHDEGTVSVGPLTVYRGASPLPPHQRGDYKAVWNDASPDPASAMLAVAGIADYTEFMKSGESSAATIRENLEITPADEVLEIGCGTGRIGRSLAPFCRRWVGADISGQMLRYAQENLQGVDNIALVELKSASLSEFADSSFDKVYCSAVFMHLDEWDRFRYVREAFRVLRPGGKCYIDNLNLSGDQAWQVFSQLSEVDPLERLPQISKTSTAEELCTYLARAGFTDLRSRKEPLLVTAWGTKP